MVSTGFDFAYTWVFSFTLCEPQVNLRSVPQSLGPAALTRWEVMGFSTPGGWGSGFRMFLGCWVPDQRWTRQASQPGLGLRGAWPTGALIPDSRRGNDWIRWVVPACACVCMCVNSPYPCCSQGGSWNMPISCFCSSGLFGELLGTIGNPYLGQ